MKLEVNTPRPCFMPNYVPENVCINQKDVNKNDISMRSNGISRGFGQSSQ